jgi:hypothetical protein
MIEGSKKRYVDETRQSSPAGLIIRQKEPTNLEMPFDQVDTYLTPTELFYIRSHFRAPKLDAADYRLSIDGAVRNPLSETRTAEVHFLDPARPHAWRCWKFDWLTPKSPANRPCWPAPKMSTGPFSQTSMTGTTAAT